MSQYTPLPPPQRRNSLFPTSANKNRAAWVAIILTVLSMLTGTILFITNGLADTKEFAVDKDEDVKDALKAKMVEDYVNKVDYTKDFTILDERQRQIKTDVQDIKGMIKDMHDDMYDKTKRRNR